MTRSFMRARLAALSQASDSAAQAAMLGVGNAPDVAGASVAGLAPAPALPPAPAAPRLPTDTGEVVPGVASQKPPWFEYVVAGLRTCSITLDKNESERGVTR